jgi:hypothetical protein
MLTEQVNAWVSETRAILSACVRLAEYFGSDEEEASFRAGLALPLTLVAAIEDPLQWAAPPLPAAAPPNVECSEALARMVSPLLQLVCEPVPDFVGTARPASDADAKALIVLFGVFSGTFARHVCAPVWCSYPSLAPEGWPL